MRTHEHDSAITYPKLFFLFFLLRRGRDTPPFFCGVDRHGVGGGEDGRGREREKDSQWETVGVRGGGKRRRFSHLVNGILAGWESGVLGIGRMGV